MEGSPDAAEPLPEVCLDMSSKEMVNDQAAQDMSSKDVITNEANRDHRKMTKEVRIESNWEGMATEASQAGPDTTKVLPGAVVKEDYRQLFEAAVKGDWKVIEKSLNGNYTVMTAEVMKKGDDHLTILDLAITAAQDKLVENLVKHFPRNCEDLYLDVDSAFRCAARDGRIRMVKALIGKIDAKSPIIHDALKLAAQSAPDRKEVIWYLVRHLKSKPEYAVMSCLVKAGHLDICLSLAHRYPELVQFGGTEERSFLKDLATMTRRAHLSFLEESIYEFIPLCLVGTSIDHFEDTEMARAFKQFKICLWNHLTRAAPFIKRSGESKFRYKCSLELAKLALTEMAKKKKPREMLEFLLTSRVVLDAASRGAFEIVKCCLERFPELMWDDSFAKQLMKEIVKGRHVELFRLMSTYKLLRGMADDDISTNIDLMKALIEWPPRCVSPDVSGVAFLMQMELQWFQVIVVGGNPFFNRPKFQVGGQSYWDEFIEQRKDLVKQAGKWMKDTSSSCSVVATLIITITFAAALTVPRSDDKSVGIPVFSRGDLSTGFVVGDAFALFFSVAATMMFLAILTSSHAIEEFLDYLPRKMVVGLGSLLASLVCMLVAFCYALLVALNERSKYIYIIVILFAIFPVLLLAILQLLPLYIKMAGSTLWPRLYRPLKLWM